MVQTKIQKNASEVQAIREEVDRINEIARKERVAQPLKTFEAVSKAYNLAASINYKVGMGFCLLNRSFYLFYIEGDLPLAYKNLADAEDLFRATSNIDGLAWAASIWGSLYVQTGEYEKAFSSYRSAIDGFKATADEEGESLAIYLLGNLYLDLKDYKNSTIYHERSFYLGEKRNDGTMLANSLTSLANDYYGMNELEKAILTFRQAIESAIKVENQNIEARAWHDLGMVYESQGDYKTAIEYVAKSLEQRKIHGNKQGLVTSLLSLGKLYSKIKDFEEAMSNLQQAIEIGATINAKPKMMRVYQELAAIYKEKDQPWQALAAYEQYMDLKATVMGEETSSQIRNANALYEAEKSRKEAEIEKLRNVELKAAYEEIEEKNQHIIDSIKYAKRIQEAILDPVDTITKQLGDAFIFYQAKDIVSGDFYWYGEVETEEEPDKKYKVIIAADCTGHGVPGAFMTVMGNDFLNDIILTRQVIEPAEILYKLDEKVSATLNKQGNSRTNDGMDITILVIDETAQKIHFAGAKNPLYLIRNQEVIETKGSKFPIGSNQYSIPKIFETHTFEITPNDVYYIFTDGCQDQFGEGGKYMKRRFREFLHQIHLLPLATQGNALDTEIRTWQGSKVQTDDWLVIGIKF
jgi:serine phosphatase RsbU (regulator of sigma subunit)